MDAEGQWKKWGKWKKCGSEGSGISEDIKKVIASRAPG
jgi:hypothetical protein